VADTYRKKRVKIHRPQGGRNRSAGFQSLLWFPIRCLSILGRGRNRYGGSDSAQSDPYTENSCLKGKPNTWKNFSEQPIPSSTRKPATSSAPRPSSCSRFDERNPFASPYYRRLSGFRAKYAKLNCVVGCPQLSKGWERVPPGSRLTRKRVSSTRPSTPLFFFHPDPRPNSITRPSWCPCSNACLLCNIWASLENTLWNLAGIAAPTAFVRSDMPLYPGRFCRHSSHHLF